MGTAVLSVITVCFQAREQVQATMESVLGQTWREFEYLVVDGASKDGTRELLEGAKERFLQAGIGFCFLSEPDEGIYDAMNKGTKMAAGRWLLFLNAGDTLAQADVFSRVFENPPDAEILYGDTLCIYQGRSRLYPALPPGRLAHEMPFCHQSAFILRNLALAHPYDTAYKVCADHQFFLSMYQQGKRFARLPLTVSVYEIAGYSDRNKLLSHREKQRMAKELGTFQFTFGWLVREAVFYLKQGVKLLFGQRLIDAVRRIRLRS